jgi:hypothetical protein
MSYGADAPMEERVHASKLGGGAMARVSDVPPLMQLAGRMMAALSQFGSRAEEVVGAGHRTADRMTGEVPTTEPGRPERPEPAPLGFGGQFAEIEGAVRRLERELDEHGSQLERMMNRLTRMG